MSKEEFELRRVYPVSCDHCEVDFRYEDDSSAGRSATLHPMGSELDEIQAVRDDPSNLVVYMVVERPESC